MNVSILKGKVLSSIRNKDNYELYFNVNDGSSYKFFHRNDCCECVEIEDICGDLDDLIGTPLLQAEEVSNYEGPDLDEDSYTWTFYKFATIKGSVTVRWLGTSTGYYSEDVEFEKVEETND